MMKTSQKGIALIKSFEGCRLKAYRCPSGVLTIGYGHTGNDVTEKTIWTQQKADSMLLKDIEKYEQYVNDLRIECGYTFNQNQFDALVSFTYNCGKANLKLLFKDGKRTKTQISNAMLLYNKSNGKVIKGLVERRKAEVSLYNTGVVIEGTGISIDTTTLPLKLEDILFCFRGNYNIRELPSENGKIVDNTIKHGSMSVKGISSDRKWVLTEYGWINVAGLYDVIK